MATVARTTVEGEGVPPASPPAARHRARPIADRLEANTRRTFGMRVVAVLALWLLRRMPVLAFPIRLARLLIGALPVLLWFLRRADRRRPPRRVRRPMRLERLKRRESIPRQTGESPIPSGRPRRVSSAGSTRQCALGAVFGRHARRPCRPLISSRSEQARPWHRSPPGGGAPTRSSWRHPPVSPENRDMRPRLCVLGLDDCE